ncbi:MAG: glutamate racemase [Porticoccaceae bacterium]|nr:MAG: glutamate racemase [Porticoccaceae bacterium]
MEPAPAILVFDSGVGGLSILAELRRLLPGARYIYGCDNAAFPYGCKDEAFLVARVETVLGRLVEETDPAVVVVACNTASTVALPRIRARVPVPVVGVVPAIKPAAQRSASRVVGLLATPATVARRYTQWLIETYAADCTVHRLGSTELVALAEAFVRGRPVDEAVVAEAIAPLFADPRLDTVVLGCTHFPLLRAALEAAAPRPVAWIDSGEAIARRVASFTGPLPGTPSAFRCLLTGDGEEVATLVEGLRRQGAASVDWLPP